MSKRIISYSLYGDSKFYCQGAIDNVNIAKEIYPDWTCRFYISANCPVLKDLQKLQCEIIVMENWSGIDRVDQSWTNKLEHKALFWRLYAMADQTIDYLIFRDTDSRLSYREKVAVDMWINSGKLAHRMHEKDEHWNGVIMPGMFGIRGGMFPHIKEMIQAFIKNYPEYNEPWVFADIIFMRDIIYPYIRNSCLGHGLRHPNPFPKHEPMTYGTFVGEPIHEEWRNQLYQ